MLDIRYIRENPEKVQKNATDKGYDVSISELLRLDDERRSLQQQVDELRARRNDIAGKMKGGKPEQALIDEGKQIKIELAEREKYFTDIDAAQYFIEYQVKFFGFIFAVYHELHGLNCLVYRILTVPCILFR